MTNIVMLCHERYRLTMQAIQSIRRNTKPEEYTLTLIDDDSHDFRVRNFLWDQAVYNSKNTTLVTVTGSRHCLGALKNLGVRHSEMTFGRGNWLCTMDHDVCVFPGWLDKLSAVIDDLFIVGGCRHPFHQPRPNPEYEDSRFVQTDAVAGYCQFMEWDDWDGYGPYVTDAPGIGQSEDFAICQKASVVGYVTPPVLTHTGITNSRGELIAGHELIERVPGVLYL